VIASAFPGIDGDGRLDGDLSTGSRVVNECNIVLLLLKIEGVRTPQ